MITSQAEPANADAPYTQGPATAAGQGKRVLQPGEPALAALEKARQLFREAWELMGKEERTPVEDERMINAAHASRYYWETAGTEINRGIAEWLLSRCYVRLGRPEPAYYHAQRCARLVAGETGSTLARAYAQEALARAHLLAKRYLPAETALVTAEALAKQLGGPEATYLKTELRGLRGTTGR